MEARRASEEGGTAANSEMKAAARVTWAGMLLDAFLGLIKCVAGTLFHSQALVADGIHSFSDVASDFLVLGVMRAARQGPDQSHPYGHQRFETMGTLVLGSVLIAVGAALAWENAQRLLEPAAVVLPEWPVLAAAAISILGKEWIYHYTRRVGVAIRSDLILANAWHSRTDALSSVVVLLATIGAMLGYVWLDVLAAVAIAGLVGYIGWRFTWASVKELVDTALTPEITEAMARRACETDGVRNVHELRSRRMGGDVLVDIHLLVDPKISVSEGHQIGMRVVRRLKEEFGQIRDITFHIDAEDDEEGTPTSTNLPTRDEVWALLKQDHELPEGTRLRLHYLGNHVHVELFIQGPADTGRTQRIRALLADRRWLGSLRLWHPED
ncbi:cation diffusion facilitator family transporter [Marinobacter salicampi]|uniref:cation diffusion facilitator family transporter n=1 Tax=Marinobacter salicampi TaxID=435907 RepID=UPI001F5E5171|nr:cation diffusion facilitator family transporter [Marinobacter salicampi]